MEALEVEHVVGDSNRVPESGQYRKHRAKKKLTNDPTKQFETLLKPRKRLERVTLAELPLGRRIKKKKLNSLKKLLISLSGENWNTDPELGWILPIFTEDQEDEHAESTTDEECECSDTDNADFGWVTEAERDWTVFELSPPQGYRVTIQSYPAATDWLDQQRRHRYSCVYGLIDGGRSRPTASEIRPQAKLQDRGRSYPAMTDRLHLQQRHRDSLSCGSTHDEPFELVWGNHKTSYPGVLAVGRAGRSSLSSSVSRPISSLVV
ncbi:hypothetical protein ILUMI_21579 [Ignelater luminosus]|uniref:Uncharacterized protein n=1 Tax=Ignelater luminosus TaxID=2038154 RepID=A0A8K0CEB0_IGNLU|nr:hypothetical protein ILUMI_21579 [Ignelater luminosus]